MRLHARTTFTCVRHPLVAPRLQRQMVLRQTIRSHAIPEADPAGVHTNNARREVGETAATPSGYQSRSASDIDMQSTAMSNPGSPMAESSDPQIQHTSIHVHGSGNGGDSDAVDGDGRPDNEDPTDGSEEDHSSEEGGDASNDSDSVGEDLEDLLGQIPNECMGSNPELDIAATLPLYEGATLSMLCATLLIVNCCKTHGVSNMFMNELLMLLSVSILP